MWYNHAEKEPDKKGPLTSKNIIPLVNYSKIGEKLAKEYKNLLEQDQFSKNFKIITSFSKQTKLRQQLVRNKI